MSEPAAPAGALFELPPLYGSAKAVGSIALSLAVFMNVLDSSIANVSLPAISGDLGVSPTQGTWVITSFAVANGISVPLTGWLAQRFGAVRLFVASVLMFVLSSWLCGLAGSIEMLVAARVLQGFVAGPMIPLSQTLLMASYPVAKVGTALAVWGITTLVAPVVGPLLGGWITDNISWPWIFYINIPVGLVAAAATWAIYRTREMPRKKLPIDRIGLALLVVWVGSLQLMLDKGKELDWFSSPLIVALAIFAALGLVFFIAWELTDAHPVVDLRLFGGRNFAFGVLTISCGYGLFFGNVVLLPLWLQQWMGYTATDAGYALAPVGILAIILTPLSGRKVMVWDPRWMVTLSFLIFLVVFELRAQFTVQTDLWHIMVPTVIQGGAMAFYFLPLTTLLMWGFPQERLAAAAGLSNFFRITAGAIGTSVTTTLWDHRATLHHANLAAGIDAADPALNHALGTLGQAGLSAPAALDLVVRQIDQQAFTRAADDIFYITGMLFVGMIALVWLMRRPVLSASARPVDSGAH